MKIYLIYCLTSAIIIGMSLKTYGQSGSGITPHDRVDSASMMFKPHELNQVVEVQPTFIGGDAEMMAYIRKNMRYPKQELDSLGLVGMVYIEFIVCKDGQVKYPRILKGLSPQSNAEAIRLVRGMPNWGPALSRKQPVNARLSIPIRFKLRRD
jgi:TonB family protein